MEQVSFDFPVSAEPSVPALETIEATFLLRADSHPPMRHTYDVAATDDVGAIVLHQPCVALQYGSGRVRLPYYRGAVLLIGTGRYQSRPDVGAAASGTRRRPQRCRSGDGANRGRSAPGFLSPRARYQRSASG